MSGVSLKSLLKKISFMGFDSIDLFGQRHKLTVVEEMGKLCQALLELKGESSSATISSEVLNTYRHCSKEEKVQFFQLLYENFAPDQHLIDQSIADYQASRTQESVQALSNIAESPRQELFRILNIAPNATYALVQMRGDLLRLLREHPELEVINQDLLHLFHSWFNRGFLQLRRIDWQTPAAVLEKLIEYESVHEIRGWPDLRRRLESDRRCFGFFHPVIPDTPLIFVEVALTSEISTTISSLIDSGSVDEDQDEDNLDTAVFYSINNCLKGLRGVSFGSFLIKQVVENLATQNPGISTYTTLSPIPGFMSWLQQNTENEDILSEEEQEQVKSYLEAPDPEQVLTRDENLKPLLLRLCAHYLLRAKSRDKPADAVARFHLGNGARLEHINWLADISVNGLQQSAGIMVNYLYDPDTMADNHEAYELEDKVICSQEVRKLCDKPAKAAKTAKAANK